MINNISFSIDDGHPLDLKMAEILIKKKLKTIFYIPVKKSGKRLTIKQIRSLGSQFEIGGHTYSHVDLTKMNSKIAWKEVSDGKKALEDILGRKITSFAFPYGHYNPQLVGLVKKAGFKNCRSGRIINFNEFNQKDFLQHPNFHIFPHQLSTDLLHCLKYGDYYSLLKRFSYRKKNHLELLNVFPKKIPLHFWCHSEDIERYHLWDLFQSIF